MSILLVSNGRRHPNHLELRLPAIYHTECLPIYGGQGSACRLQGFKEFIPRVFWTVRRISITIALKHTTVYYVASMKYHPSRCIYVTFKHFLVGIVSGVECDIKEAFSKKEIYARLLFCQQLYVFISTYYHLNRQNNILRLFHTRRRILSKRTTSTTPEKKEK